MVTDKLIIIRVKSTGTEYAYPVSKFSELPTVRIEDGSPGHTNFSRHELKHMEDHGSAIRIGFATFALNISYDASQAEN